MPEGGLLPQELSGHNASLMAKLLLESGTRFYYRLHNPGLGRGGLHSLGTISRKVRLKGQRFPALSS